MNQNACYSCCNEFNARSKPEWAFGPNARLLGLAHTSCSLPPKHHKLGRHDGQVQDVIEFMAWAFWSGYEISSRLAMLWEQPSETLTDEQLDVLTRWVRQEKLDVREVLALVDEHTAMIRAYQTWRRAGVETQEARAS